MSITHSWMTCHTIITCPFLNNSDFFSLLQRRSKGYQARRLYRVPTKLPVPSPPQIPVLKGSLSGLWGLKSAHVNAPHFTPPTNCSAKSFTIYPTALQQHPEFYWHLGSTLISYIVGLSHCSGSLRFLKLNLLSFFVGLQERVEIDIVYQPAMFNKKHPRALFIVPRPRPFHSGCQQMFLM